MTKKLDLNISSPLLYIVLGVVLAIWGGTALNVVLWIAGGLFIAMGVLDILKKSYTSGVVNVLLGIAIVAVLLPLIDIALIVLGLFIAFRGAMDLIPLIKRGVKDIFKYVSPALTIIVGLALVFGNGVEIIITIVGVLLVIDGVLGFLKIK